MVHLFYGRTEVSDPFFFYLITFIDFFYIAIMSIFFMSIAKDLSLLIVLLPIFWFVIFVTFIFSFLNSEIFGTLLVVYWYLRYLFGWVFMVCVPCFFIFWAIIGFHISSVPFLVAGLFEMAINFYWTREFGKIMESDWASRGESSAPHLDEKLVNSLSQEKKEAPKEEVPILEKKEEPVVVEKREEPQA